MRPKNAIEQKEQLIRKLLKRDKELGQQVRALGYFKLENPIRHGWYKEFKISYKIERYKHKKYLHEIAKKLNRQYWGRTKAEADTLWQEQTSKYLIYKDVPTLSPKSYRKLSDPAKRFCKKFKYIVICRYTKNRRWKTRYYVRFPKPAYEITYARAYITHRKRIDPTLESELEYIAQMLESKKLIKVYRKMMGYNSWKWIADDYKYKRKRAKQTLQRQLHYLEHTSWDIN